MRNNADVRARRTGLRGGKNATPGAKRNPARVPNGTRCHSQRGRNGLDRVPNGTLCRGPNGTHYLEGMLDATLTVRHVDETAD